MSFERKFCWIQVREIFSRVLSIATVLNAETFEGFINVGYFLSSFFAADCINVEG